MFGPHVIRGGGGGARRITITEHIRRARQAAEGASFDARAFQIFVAGPRNFSMTLRPEEADELKVFLDERPELVVVAHGTYMDFPWNGKPYAIKFIHTEIEMCKRAGVIGLVIHLGKPPVDEVMKYIPSLAGGPSDATDTSDATDVTGPQNALIFLEVPHVKPENSNYETPEKLSVLFQQIREMVDPTLCKFGLCIDTAHLWSCGVDLRSYEAAEAWIGRLEAVSGVIPSDRIILHLNDSLDTMGSGLDHHAGLLSGKIWGGYKDRPAQSGLAAFVNYALRNNIPTILERKPHEALLEDYSVLERLTRAVRADA